MGDSFNELVRQLADYDVAVDEAYLHGLLTGCATIPEVDSDSLVATIAGDRPLADAVIDAVTDNINRLSKDLSGHRFQARFDVGNDADATRWVKGYTRAVEIHEGDWQELNEIYTDAAVNLLALHSMSNPDFHRKLNVDLPGPEDLRKRPQLVTDLVSGIFDEFHLPVDHDEIDENMDDDVEFGFDPSDDEPASWFQFTDEELSDMDEPELMVIVTSSDDLLPLEVVMEAASRGDAMVQLLRQHLEEESHWTDDADESDWWALLHAIFILGLMPGEAAAEALLLGFRKVTFDENNDLSDWLSAYWPALCRHKTGFTTAPLKEIAEDRNLGWYARGEAVGCVLAAAADNGDDALEQAIDWLATMCGEAADDTEFRVTAGHSLLDFPRERHRSVMEDLVDLQQPGSLVANSYDRDEIQRAFDVGDNPEWQRFFNPWEFYDPDEVDRRQDRLFGEDQDRELPSYALPARVRTYKRTVPKVGRNDPCPCGSGKKYKKCCLDALH